VGFVNHNQVEGIEFAGPFVGRLDAGNDDRVTSVAPAQASRIDAKADLGADLGKLVSRLLQQLFDVRQD
jgi:hypothetical protein